MISTKENFYLHPGDLLVSKTPVRVTTVLGSCVAVCLWDTSIKAGGINHYLLPNLIDEIEPLKYGYYSIPELIRRILALGASKKSTVAKVFGGAQNLTKNDTNFKIGQANINIAFELLREHHITVVNHDVGGSLGRKLIFHTDTGRAYMKTLRSQK